MLRRTVLVVDEKNIIRYVDFVPGGGLPDIKGALNAAKQVLLESSWKCRVIKLRSLLLKYES